MEKRCHSSIKFDRPRILKAAKGGFISTCLAEDKYVRHAYALIADDGAIETKVANITRASGTFYLREEQGGKGFPLRT